MTESMQAVTVQPLQLTAEAFILMLQVTALIQIKMQLSTEELCLCLEAMSEEMQELTLMKDIL